MHRHAALTLSLALASVASVGFAQSSSSLAETLYRDGKKLLEEKKYAAACPKLAESQRLDPAGGTAVALALCYEGDGKLASAWTAYQDALTLAKRAGRADREKAARDAIARLEPKLPTLTVAVPAESQAPGLEVKRGDVPLGTATWGTKMPVDPGEITITASAPGKKPVSMKVRVAGPGDAQTVTIPRLEAAEAVAPTPATSGPPPPVDAAKPPADDGSGRRTAALVVGGVGVVGLGVGVAFGLMAKSKLDASSSECHGANLCTANGVSLRSDALSRATVSTIGFGVGAAALAGGVVLWVTSPRASTDGAFYLSPHAAPGALGWAAGGVF